MYCSLMIISILESLGDREVACLTSDRQGSNFKSSSSVICSSHHHQEVILTQISLDEQRDYLNSHSLFIFLVS